jgi:hypothetical protein
LIFDPFRRVLNWFLTFTPVGRQPDLTFANGPGVETEGKSYQLQILNEGQETAEDVAIRVGYNEKITDATELEARNIPPAPNIDIELDGQDTARLNIPQVRREFDGEQIPLMIHFTVEENSESAAAHRIEDENALWVGYSYSWTFLGERYFEADTEVIEYTTVQ